MLFDDSCEALQAFQVQQKGVTDEVIIWICQKIEDAGAAERRLRSSQIK